MTAGKKTGMPTDVDPANFDLDHAGLKALAKELNRPLSTLEVLRHDPFTAGVPARRAGAEWFADLWQRLALQPGAHLRRIHYLLVSQEPPVLMANGKPYLNTETCWDALNRTSLDARYLGLVDAGALVDRRNDEPMVFLTEEHHTGTAAHIYAAGDMQAFEPPAFEPPRLLLLKPHIPQHFHVEIWVEKTTIDDVIVPIAERYRINLVRGAGELSHTRCLQFIRRALISGLAVRVLYISDFDPAGASMPVAVARKIEHLIYQRQLHDLDIQVRPIALTHEQCVQYRLPRTPLKGTETRGAAFEARFGEGATELDALEALRPGELAQIIEREIARYFDADLDDRIDDTAAEVNTAIRDINARVHKRHAKAMKALQADRDKVLAAIAAFEKKARPVLNKIRRDLVANAPDLDAVEWPEPDDGDDDIDPLFDSTRDYLDQVDRYKEHQGKPTAAPPRKQTDPFPATCTECGRSFMTTRKTAKFCSDKCRHAHNYNKEDK